MAPLDQSHNKNHRGSVGQFLIWFLDKPLEPLGPKRAPLNGEAHLNHLVNQCLLIQPDRHP